MAPTLLALTGGLPAVGSFAGHDVSCPLVRDCLPDQVAYLTSVYDNLVGLASADGLLLYSLSTESFQEATLAFEPISDEAVGGLACPPPVGRNSSPCTKWPTWPSIPTACGRGGSSARDCNGCRTGFVVVID